MSAASAMSQSRSRSTSAVQPVLDRRIIDEFAPIVRELIEAHETTPDRVQLFLDELDRLQREQREVYGILEGDEP